MCSTKEKTKLPGFTFQDICVSYHGNYAVTNASGNLCNGQILGVFGPKGSGKTSLLSSLAGYSGNSHGCAFLHGLPVNKFRSGIGYCQAEDVFLPTLTVEETMKYFAILRLPLEMDTSVKIDRVKVAADTMELDLFANCLVQMLNKDLRKRLSIACEMVLCPNILIIDDPLSGLDFEQSLQMTRLLQFYIQRTNKMLIIAFHQCPGYVYQLCSKMLFLWQSKVAFSGRADELLQFLRGIDLQPPQGYNAAEYLLELLCKTTLNDQVPVQDRILHAFSSTLNTKENNTEGSTRRRDFRLPSPNLDCRLSEVHYNGTKMQSSAKYNEQSEEVQVLLENNDKETLGPHQFKPMLNGFHNRKENQVLAPYWHQFFVLLARSFHNARRRILFPVNIIQNAYILAICVLIWWRVERRDDTIKDRMGLFFFTVVQWAFFALLDAIITFPKELKVVNKERKYNYYSLSAYCLSKTISELPLAIIQPCIYMSVMYWVANLNGLYAFLGSVGVLCLDVLAAQSIGLFVGAALQPPWTISVVSLGLLSMMLWGGAFNTLPPWLRWGKYASYFFYGLNAFIVLEFKDAPPITCSNSSTMPLCTMINPVTNQTMTSFDSEVVLAIQQIDWPLWCYLSVLAGIFVVTRLLWYLIMRRQRLS